MIPELFPFNPTHRYPSKTFPLDTTENCPFFKELQENGDWHPICNFSPAKEIPKSLNQNGRGNDKIR
ncbi:MAG: hypothetical protein DMG28_04795 [Acidobacteria bacterium]|nr:MAG: hypothetical protein DMG28_04795 [Acidobacteriota bacterium]